MQKSFAVITRVFDGEAPYLQSFIDHHRSIGVDRFYFVLSPGQSPVCREILAANQIGFLEVQSQKVELVWREVKEDYVSVIDADEYLHPEVIRFAYEEEFSSLLMPWRMTAALDDDGFVNSEKPFFSAMLGLAVAINNIPRTIKKKNRLKLRRSIVLNHFIKKI